MKSGEVDFHQTVIQLVEYFRWGRIEYRGSKKFGVFMGMIIAGGYMHVIGVACGKDVNGCRLKSHFSYLSRVSLWPSERAMKVLRAIFIVF